LISQQLVPTDQELSCKLDEIAHFTRDEDKAAVEWIVTMREGLRAVQASPEAIHLVHYEDLTRNPRNVLEPLLERCGLAADPGLLDYAERVLRPLPARVTTELSPAIRPAFMRTMVECGHSV
jgi:hypothetical protein